ncbi:LETM1-domain-containing protein, partial [Clavulina sp. PMI_390]
SSSSSTSSNEEKSTAVSTESGTSLPAKPSEPKPPLFTRVWTTVKKEAAHYWDGTKLLGAEIKVSWRLLRRLLKGKQLTRRERRQLRRTTGDLLRLVPFSVFVVVPFMELLLPVAIKLFPNMLPSTFEDKFAADEKQRRLLRVRLEMAKFLQETLKESGIKGGKSIVGTEEFKAFFYKVRSTGESPSTEDIVKVAKLFDDELTLDNLSRPQLVSICRYMGLNAFGTDQFLKYQIRNRLQHIKRDDTLIQSEGVEALSTAELQAACQSRGVRTLGVSPSRLRDNLNQWITLHITNDISGVLLILSRAFDWGETSSSGENVVQALGSVLASLPDNLVRLINWRSTAIGPATGRNSRSCNSKKSLSRMKLSKKPRIAQSMLPDSEVEVQLSTSALLMLTLALEEEIDDARMTTEQLNELGEALSVLSAKSSVIKERNELQALLEDNLQSEKETSGESSPSQSLSKRIRGMIKKIDDQLSAYDARVGDSLQLIQADAQGLISVNDLERALNVIKHKPDTESIESIVRKLDPDKDGFVVLEHVLDLVREEGLGTVVDDAAQDLLGQGRELKESRPRKEDIVQE